MNQSLEVCLDRRDQDCDTGSYRRDWDNVCDPSWGKPGPKDVIQAEDERNTPRNPIASLNPEGLWEHTATMCTQMVR